MILKSFYLFKSFRFCDVLYTAVCLSSTEGHSMKKKCSENDESTIDRRAVFVQRNTVDRKLVSECIPAPHYDTGCDALLLVSIKATSIPWLRHLQPIANYSWQNILATSLLHWLQRLPSDLMPSGCHGV
jgi:hypothetical protein